MSEFPEDIMKAAAEAAQMCIVATLGRQPCEDMQDTIAAAILAERERCMLIARDWPLAGLIKTNDENPQSIFVAGARAQSRTIAEAIMKGGAA